MPSLVIVESPAKARTISRFLGDDFIVEASIGSIRDLEPKGLAVDVDDGFKPTYVVPADKKDVVRRLKAALKDADDVYLATDEDREGEAIAWHLAEVLKPRVPMRRMVFHEITRQAIENAVDESRDIDSGLVDAQEARRIVDRLFGYPVSEVLWRKVATGPVGGPGAVAGGPPGRRARARAHGVRRRRLLGPAGRLPRRPGLPGHARRARRQPGRHRQGLRQPGPRAARRRRRGRRGRGAGARHRPRRVDVHRLVGRREALPQLAQAAVHHLDPAAGGRTQARHDARPRSCAPRRASTSAATSPTCAPTR